MTTDARHDSLEAPDAADIQGTEPIPPSEVNSPAAAPPLVRPDRQFTFDGLPHYEWPKAEEDRDTLTVDGVRAATHVETLIKVLRRAKTKRNELLLKERGEIGVRGLAASESQRSSERCPTYFRATTR